MLPALLGSASDKLHSELADATADVEKWTNAKQDRPVKPVLPPNPQPTKPSDKVIAAADEDPAAMAALHDWT